MNRVPWKTVILFGLLLGIIRILMYYAVLRLKFSPGYLMDILFVVYMPICLLLLTPKKIYSLLHLILISILAGAISIIVYQSFLTFRGHPIFNEAYLLSRGIAAVSVLFLSILAAILYYFIQSIFKNKWETPSIDIESIGH